MSTYREQGQVDRGEPVGFPQVPPVQGRISRDAILAADPDVLKMAAEGRRRASRVRAARALVVLAGLAALVALEILDILTWYR